MAPELFSGNPYDGFKAECFACGIMLFSMLFGDYPFEDVQQLDALAETFHYRNCSENDSQFWAQYNGGSELDEKLKALIKGLLRGDPEERLSIKEVQANEWFKGEVLEEPELCA